MALTKKIDVQEYFAVLWKMYHNEPNRVKQKKIQMLINMSDKPIYDPRAKIVKPVYSNRKLSKILKVPASTVQTWKKKYVGGGIRELLSVRNLMNRTIDVEVEEELKEYLKQEKTFVEICHIITEKYSSKITYSNLLKYVKKHLSNEYDIFKKNKVKARNRFHIENKKLKKSMQEAKDQERTLAIDAKIEKKVKEKEFKFNKSISLKLKELLQSERNFSEKQICKKMSKYLRVEFTQRYFWLYWKRHLKEEGLDWYNRNERDKDEKFKLRKQQDISKKPSS